MSLPLAHEDHMPPEGKPQPSADIRRILEWWVEAGATDRKVGELKPPAAVQQLLASRFAPSQVAPQRPPPKSLAEALPLAETLSDELGVSITALSPNEPWLQCNASIAGTNFGDADLGKLVSLAATCAGLIWPDTRDRQQPRVCRAHAIAHTLALGAHSHHRLRNRPAREPVRARVPEPYGTAVSDASQATVKALPRLRQVYLWQTR